MQRFGLPRAMSYAIGSPRLTACKPRRVTVHVGTSESCRPAASREPAAGGPAGHGAEALVGLRRPRGRPCRGRPRRRRPVHAAGRRASATARSAARLWTGRLRRLRIAGPGPVQPAVQRRPPGTPGQRGHRRERKPPRLGLGRRTRSRAGASRTRNVPGSSTASTGGRGSRATAPASACPSPGRSWRATRAGWS